MKDALDVHRTLLAAEIPHEVVRLRRPVSSADEIPEALGLPPDRCVSVRVYQADERLAAVLVRAGDHPHPGAVLAALEARSLRSAPSDLVNAATDFAAALVSPVLIPPDIEVLADSCLGHSDVLYAATGDSGTALGIPSRWLLTASRAKVAELCAPAPGVDDLTVDLDAEVNRLVSERNPG
jgi:prolyl-tRNA editing enzyme YbaK/EbsC (Cys-tRNA(Pro) deacylase)